jgi:hypothetical protein
MSNPKRFDDVHNRSDRAPATKERSARSREDFGRLVFSLRAVNRSELPLHAPTLDHFGVHDLRAATHLAKFRDPERRYPRLRRSLVSPSSGLYHRQSRSRLSYLPSPSLSNPWRRPA